MPSFTYGTTIIEYTVCHKAAKRDCTIAVDWTHGVTVFAPEGVDHQRINDVLRRKAPWILRRLAEFREIKAPTTRSEFVSGEKYPYLGRYYRLKVIAGDVSDASLAFRNGRFIGTVPQGAVPSWHEQRLRSTFRDWYIAHGHAKIEQRVKLFADKACVRIKSLSRTNKRVGAVVARTVRSTSIGGF